MARFEVVIPFYQREAGHLVNALASIFAQGVENIRVNIVDDGSPRPAALDLAMVPEAQRARVNLVVQKNTGANGARNRGLSEVGPDARYVAFLDSDDTWLPGHLERAAAALDRPSANFFYDTIRVDEAFAEGYCPPEEIIDPGHFVRPEDAPYLMEVGSPLHLLCGEWYRHMHLSVTVLSGALARSVRFDRNFTIADDYEFFYQCARRPGFWLIDTRNGAERGSGANIWHGIKASALRYSQEKYYSMLVLSRLSREAKLDKASKHAAKDRIRIYREQFFWAQRDRMKEGHKPDLDLWLKYIINDPGFGGFVLSRVIGRRKPAAS